ncbi:MAG: hypothetical protein NTV36_01165 [Candidatus Staskawiczbacteria bacterium]|nr:hypothetical protein [Candidatus Staskawiczbacteria bacterium]
MVLKKILLAVLAVLLFVSLAGNAWLGYQLFATLTAYRSQQSDTKVLAFTSMFVEDVLMANKEIDFDTRLALETAVRGLNDQDIFDQWQRFTKSSEKENASNEAKLLLDLLVKKAVIKK